MEEAEELANHLPARDVLIQVADLYQSWRLDHDPQITEEAAKNVTVENNDEGDTYLAAIYRAELATLAASDYARGVAVALACHQLAFTQFAAARACLEASALSRWLFEPGLANGTRFERICEVVRHDLTEGLKLANQSNLTEAQEYFRGRLDNLRTVAGKLGVRASLDTKGGVVSFGARLNIAELADSHLSAAHEYRLWSSVVHGASWALTRAGLQETKVADTLFPTPIVAIRRDPEAERHLIVATLRCFAAASFETVAVMGWDRDAFVQRFAAICDPYGIDVSDVTDEAEQTGGVTRAPRTQTPHQNSRQRTPTEIRALDPQSVTRPRGSDGREPRVNSHLGRRQ